MMTGGGIYEEQRVFNIEATAIDATASSQFVIAAGFHKAHIINTAAADVPTEVKIKNKLVTFLSCHPKWSQSVAVISGSDIGIYSLDTMRQQVKWKHANGSSRFVTDLCWSYFESNLLVTCSPYDSTLVRDIRSCRKVSIEIGAQSGASQAKFSPMLDHIMATSNCNQAILWDIRNPRRSIASIDAHQSPVGCLKWHPVQKHSFFTCSKNNVLKCWDIFDENGEFSGNLDCHERDLEAWRFWFSPDGEEYAVINSPLTLKSEGQLEVYQYPFQENLNPLKIDNSDLFVDVCWSRHQTKPRKFVWALRQSKGLIRHAIVFDYSSENREEMSTPLAQSAMDEDADRLVGISKSENGSASSSEFGSPEKEKGGIMIGEMDLDQQKYPQKESVSPASWSESSMKFSPSGGNMAALVAQYHLSRHGGGSIPSPIPSTPVVTDHEKWITAPSVTGGDLWTEMDALWTVEAEGITMTEINIPRAALGFTYEHYPNAKKLGFELRFHKNFIENGKLIVKLLSKDCPLNPDQAKRILFLMQEESDRQLPVPSAVPIFTRVMMEMKKLVASLNCFDDFEERKKSISSFNFEENESEGSESSLRHSMSLSFVPSQLDEFVPTPRTSGAQFDSSGYLVRFGNFRKTEKIQRSESKLSEKIDFKSLGIIDVTEAESESKVNLDFSSDDEKNGIIFETRKFANDPNDDEFEKIQTLRMNKRQKIRALRRLQSSEDPGFGKFEDFNDFSQDSETTASENSNEDLTSDSSENSKENQKTKFRKTSLESCFLSSDSSVGRFRLSDSEEDYENTEEDPDFGILEDNEERFAPYDSGYLKRGSSTSLDLMEKQRILLEDPEPTDVTEGGSFLEDSETEYVMREKKVDREDSESLDLAKKKKPHFQSLEFSKFMKIYKTSEDSESQQNTQTENEEDLESDDYSEETLGPDDYLKAPKSSLFPFGDKFSTPRSFFEYLSMMEPILKDIAENKRFLQTQTEEGSSFSPELLPKGDSVPFHCVSPVRNYSLSSSPTTAAIWLHRNNPPGRLSSSPTSGRTYSSRYRGGSLTLNDPENNLKGSSSDALVSTPVELFDVSHFLVVSRKMAKKYRFIGNSFRKMIKRNKRITEDENRQEIVKTWEICETYVKSCSKQKLFEKPVRCSDQFCPTNLWDIDGKYDSKQEIERRGWQRGLMMSTNRYRVPWNAGDVNAQFFANLLEGHIAQGDVQAIAAITCTLGEPCKLPRRPRPRRLSSSTWDSSKSEVPEEKFSMEKLCRSTSEMNIVPSSPLINVMWPPNFNRTERSSSIGNAHQGPLAERNTVHGSLMTVDPNENPQKKEEDNFQYLRRLALLKPRSNSVEVGDAGEFGLFLAETLENPVLEETPTPPVSETPIEEVDEKTIIFNYDSDGGLPTLDTNPNLDHRRGTSSEPFISGVAIDQFEFYRIQYAEILSRWGFFKKSAESHGGHSAHMLKWFKEQTVCPFGCGCSCPL
ncbi:hypothetical protein FO519_009107 [Halicephalobus sp. NKZ332]|nr:hypothetical protein FO519_009107 [Halicephalobus sp. NKZ332]